MRLWEWKWAKDVKKKKPSRMPLDRIKRRFAKNREKFCITLSDGSEYELTDRKDVLEIRRIDNFGGGMWIRPSAANSVFIKKDDPFDRKDPIDAEVEL